VVAGVTNANLTSAFPVGLVVLDNPGSSAAVAYGLSTTAGALVLETILVEELMG
jgi:hypothetical protein